MSHSTELSRGCRREIWLHVKSQTPGVSRFHTFKFIFNIISYLNTFLLPFLRLVSEVLLLPPRSRMCESAGRPSLHSLTFLKTDVHLHHKPQAVIAQCFYLYLFRRLWWNFFCPKRPFAVVYLTGCSRARELSQMKASERDLTRFS